MKWLVFRSCPVNPDVITPKTPTLVTSLKTFDDLTIAQRRSFSSAKLMYAAAALISLAVWVCVILTFASFLAEPIDNPAGMGAWFFGLVILSLPYTGLAVPLVFSRTMKAVGYEFDAAIPRFTTGFIFCATISLIWYLVIQSNEIGWQYTGLFWMIFTVFLAPAYLGGVFTARHYNSRPTAA